MLIMGIETSCDETSVAIVDNGTDIRANVIASQIDLHALTGGVVPEVASREHVQQINIVIEQALKASGCTFNNLDAIAVANRPGLMGALMVGASAAKAISYALKIPLIGIHHIEAHIYANFLLNPNINFPLVCLVASGGHTQIFHMAEHGKYQLLGKTLDDAAGEAFDKSARLLHLGYPGGPVIDRLAKDGNSAAIKLPRARLMEGSLDFSFSGLKTAVLNATAQSLSDHSVEDWAASIQEAIIEVLVDKTMKAAELTNAASVLAAGGVAANSRLKDALSEACVRRGLFVFIPTPTLCTDNAAMIACAGFYRLKAGEVDTLGLDVIASEQLS